MKNMRKLEGVVKNTLEISESAREDDFLLVCKVYGELNGAVKYKNFEYVMKNHKELGLPSFESITRARRKLQSKYVYLRPPKEIQRVRTEQMDRFREYALQEEDENDWWNEECPF